MDALKDLIDRYRYLNSWLRAVLCILPGLLLGAYIYSDRGSELEIQLEAKRSDESIARRQFERARQRKMDLPRLEEQLAFTEEQMRRAKEKLPDFFYMDEILQKTAVIAKELGVELLTFHPQDAVVKGTSFRYEELPIKLDVRGTYNQLAVFMDRLTQLQKIVYLRNIELMSWVPSEYAARRGGDNGQTNLASTIRRSLRVASSFEMLIYRGTGAEAAPPIPPPGTAADPDEFNPFEAEG